METFGRLKFLPIALSLLLLPNLAIACLPDIASDGDGGIVASVSTCSVLAIVASQDDGKVHSNVVTFDFGGKNCSQTTSGFGNRYLIDDPRPITDNLFLFPLNIGIWQVSTDGCSGSAHFTNLNFYVLLATIIIFFFGLVCRRVIKATLNF